MNNKILIEIEIPSIEKKYDVFIPINKKVGTIKKLLEQALLELSDKSYWYTIPSEQPKYRIFDEERNVDSI